MSSLNRIAFTENSARVDLVRLAAGDYIDETVLCDDVVALCDDPLALVGVFIAAGKIPRAIIRHTKAMLSGIGGAIIIKEVSLRRPKGKICQRSSPTTYPHSLISTAIKPLPRTTMPVAIIKSTKKSQLSQPRLASTAPRIQTHSTKKPQISQLT